MLALAALLPLSALVDASPVQKRYADVKIRSGSTGQCLTADSNAGVGSRVYTADCANAQTWQILPGSGSVFLGSSFSGLALDAGENPGDGGGLKLWTSYPGLYQQTWYLTDDRRIAITGGSQCLDSGNSGQTWQCFPNNDNQVWYVDQTDGSGGTTTSVAPSTTSTTSSPSSTGSPTGPIYADPASGGRRIRVNGNNAQCVTVMAGYSAIGTNVAVTGCWRNDETFIDEQLWDLPDGLGQVKVHAKPELCLDAGSNPANGGEMKIWSCLDVPQQQWNFVDGTLRVNAGGQCLDVKKESTPNYQKPYNYQKELQTWACDSQDPYQHFSLYSGPDVPYP